MTGVRAGDDGEPWTASGQVNLVAVPRPSWKPFFERVVATRTHAENQRETRVFRGIPTQLIQIRFSYRLATVVLARGQANDQMTMALRESLHQRGIPF